MRIKNKKDFWAGIMFVFFGSLFVVIGNQYAFGSAAKMGPGYFPQMVGGLLACLGLLITLGSIKAGTKPEEIRQGSWKVVFKILFPVALFGLFLNTLGLLVCLIMLVVLSCLASKEFKWQEIILTSLFLALLSYGIFVLALQLQFPLWPSFVVR